jgi:hypothetical protein
MGLMTTALAQPLDLDNLALSHEAHLGRGGLHKFVEIGVLDLVGTPAAPADQQDALMVVAEMRAGRVGVAAFDLVYEAVGEEEIQRAVDGRRRDRFMLRAR